MDAKAEIAAAIERVKQTEQRDLPDMNPFKHSARFEMLLLSSNRRTPESERGRLKWYIIPKDSAEKNESAENGYWGENWQWINPSDSQKRWVNMRIIAGRLEQILRRLADLEYKLDVHMNTLDELAHKM